MHVCSGRKPNLAHGLPPWTTGFKGFIYNSGTVGSLIISVFDKQHIRRQIRQQRRQLSKSQRQHAAEQLLGSLLHAPEFLYSQHIALYLSNDGEIDTAPIIDNLQQRQKTLYLPVIHPFLHGQQYFISWHAQQPLRRNRFGIQEPKLTGNTLIPTAFLQLICLPLVAFDEQGNRLGMGGGFYDRSLAFMHQPKGNKPALIGLAYELQKFSSLPVEPWDQPLKAIATERQLYRINPPEHYKL